MEIIRAGRTVTLHGRPEGSHLWIILTNRDPKTDQVLGVMVVTTKPHTDKATLRAGDHPRVVHDSSLSCADAKRFKVAKLKAAWSTGRCVLEADLRPDTLASVRTAFLASTRTVHADADYCRARVKSAG